MEQVYAGFWRRFAAFAIDYMLLVFVFGILASPFAARLGYFCGHAGAAICASLGVNPRTVSPSTVLAMFFFEYSLLVYLLLGWPYFTLFESSGLQATPGKLALGIIVTDLEGKRIGLGRATLRFWGRLVSALPLLAGFFLAGVMPQKRALHDMLSGTLCLRAGSSSQHRRGCGPDPGSPQA
ncbi:RDD family protein [Desulfothermobacter acidiphilus]|uniref:RDD family protein n=1 Tax=Desulfothermobacter acidiphilus TaxID=1938353 RepID=UPI003F8BD936